jgi:hypothetical protein
MKAPEAWPLDYIEECFRDKNDAGGLFQYPVRRLGLQGRQHFIYMATDFDLAENRLQLAGLVDHKRTALDTPILSTVHILFFITAVRLRDEGLFIAEQGKG